MLCLCIHLRDFATLAVTAFGDAAHGRDGAPAAIDIAIAILSGEPPLERVFAANSAARKLGVACGMSRLQAESLGTGLLRRDMDAEQRAFAALLRCAERFSPRIEILSSPQAESCGATLLLDVSGCERLLGAPQQIASAVHHAICELVWDLPPSSSGIRDQIGVAVSQKACAAVLAARGLPGTTTIAPGGEAATLAPLPLSVLGPDEEQSETLEAWGIRTLRQLGALEPRALAARLGQSGLRLHRQARGEDSHLLAPHQPPADAEICAGVELEHPVELLDPLLCLLNQLLEEALARARQRALAIASLEVTLVLANPPVEGASAPTSRDSPEDVRTIRPALPERNRLALLKLIQLDLEMRPPGAALKALRIVAHPAPPQSAQHGLFAAQAPEPGRLQILLGRLRKLAGDGRAGSPELLDNRAGSPPLPTPGRGGSPSPPPPTAGRGGSPEAFRMARFAPEGEQSRRGSPSFRPVSCRADLGLDISHVSSATATARDVGHPPALRLVRPPRGVKVELRDGAPVAFRDSGLRCIVQASSGPWRTSGQWWVHSGWCREEWEVCVQYELWQNARDWRAAGQSDGDSCCLRLAHDPANHAWYVIGVYD
jgi:protein ImuB